MDNDLIKNLIETQKLKTSNEQTFNSLFRCILEPVLENSADANVIFRINHKTGLLGLLKRLELDNSVNMYELCGNPKLQNYEYLLIESDNYNVGLIWEKEEYRINYEFVSELKLLSEIINNLKQAHKSIFAKYVQKSDIQTNKNNLYVNMVNKLLNTFCDNETKNVQESSNQTDNYKYLQTRVTAHEIRNQLSICDLYLNIIKRYCDKNEIQIETIDNSVNCMEKAIKIANNCLIELKSINNSEIKPCNLKELINSAVSLSKAYAIGKDISFEINNNSDVDILADENKFSAVIINLIKNATESFEAEEKNKFIKIETEKKEGFARVSISNNGKKIADTEKIFDEGFTTKKEGSGLGLYICKKTMEEQFGKIALKKSDEKTTEFELTASIV